MNERYLCDECSTPLILDLRLMPYCSKCDAIRMIHPCPLESMHPPSKRWTEKHERGGECSGEDKGTVWCPLCGYCFDCGGIDSGMPGVGITPHPEPWLVKKDE